MSQEIVPGDVLWSQEIFMVPGDSPGDNPGVFIVPGDSPEIIQEIIQEFS